MKMICIRSVALVAGLCGWLGMSLLPAAWADDAWYVATNVTHTFDGGSWATAFTNIQDALDAAGVGDTIHFAGHTFTLTTQLVWTAGKDNIALLGGYEGVGTPGAYDVDRWPTVITRDTAFNTRLMFVDGADDVVVARMAFVGGSATAPADVQGGGAMLVRDAVNFTLRDCRLSENYLQGTSSSKCYGGALHVLNSTGIISNTVFMANEVRGRAAVGYGGGVNVSGGAMTLRDVVFLGNRAWASWASENYRYGVGGGISFHGGNHTLRNALLFLNQARRHVVLTATEGGGIYVWNNATVLIENTTAYGHSSEGLYIVAGTVTVKNSIFARNNPDIGGLVAPASVSDSLIGDGTGGGTVNILTGDPGLNEGSISLRTVPVGIRATARWPPRD